MSVVVVCLSTLLQACGNPLYRSSHTTVHDVNVDGIPDAVYLERTWNFEEGYSYPIAIRIGTKAGGLTEPRYVANIVDQEGGPADVRLEDLDGDRLPDLTFSLGREHSRRYWLRNDGKGSFDDFRAAPEQE